MINIKNQIDTLILSSVVGEFNRVADHLLGIPGYHSCLDFSVQNRPITYGDLLKLLLSRTIYLMTLSPKSHPELDGIIDSYRDVVRQSKKLDEVAA